MADQQHLALLEQGAHCLTKNLTLHHSQIALYVNHYLHVQQGHNVTNLPSPKRQQADTMRSQRKISREATRLQLNTPSGKIFDGAMHPQD